MPSRHCCPLHEPCARERPPTSGGTTPDAGTRSRKPKESSRVTPSRRVSTRWDSTIRWSPRAPRCVVTVPERAAPLLRVVTGEVEQGAGVEANLGKTRVDNAAGGDAPPGIAALGPDVWCGVCPLLGADSLLSACPSVIPTSSALTPLAASRMRPACSRNSSACLIYKARGFCWPIAQRLGRSTCFATFPRQIYCLTPAPTMRQFGTLSKACLAVRALTRATMGDAWPAARAVAFLLPSFGGLGLLAAERARGRAGAALLASRSTCRAPAR